MNFKNLVNDLLPELGSADEQVDLLVENPHLRIERIVSTGQASPPGFWYDQDEHEWVMVLRGKAGLLFKGEDSPRELGPGDQAHIPAHAKHRVQWTARDEPTVWLAVFYPADS